MKIKIPGAELREFVFGEDAASREEYKAFIPAASLGVFWLAE
jgi:hypothetical protein